MRTSRQPVSVLVVDDSVDTAASTAQLLSLAGHTTRYAVSGEDALDLAAADPPDVILMDLHMPGLGGCEVARQLAARRPVKPPLLIAVTGLGGTADRARTAASGFHLHLVKPVEPAVLVGVLQRVQESLTAENPFQALSSRVRDQHLRLPTQPTN